jgi:hypothetical protein
MSWAVASIAVIGVVLLAAGARLRWAAMVAWSLGLIGAAYALALPHLHGAAAPVSAALLGAVLLIAAEVGFAKVDRYTTSTGNGGRRAAWLGGCGLGALAVSVIVLTASSAHVARSLPMTVAGTLAAVGVVGSLSLYATDDDLHESDD